MSVFKNKDTFQQKGESLWTATKPAEIIPIVVYFQYWPICAGERNTAVHNTHMYCSYVVVNTYNGLRLRLWGGPFCRLFERMRVSTHTQKVAKAKSARSMLCCTHKFSEGLSGLRHNESQRAMFLYVNTMRVFLLFANLCIGYFAAIIFTGDAMPPCCFISCSPQG